MPLLRALVVEEALKQARRVGALEEGAAAMMQRIDQVVHEVQVTTLKQARAEAGTGAMRDGAECAVPRRHATRRRPTYPLLQIATS